MPHLHDAQSSDARYWIVSSGWQKAMESPPSRYNSVDVQPLTRFTVQIGNGKAYPAEPTQISRSFPSKLMRPSSTILRPGKYYTVLRPERTVVTPHMTIISGRVYGPMITDRTQSHVPTIRVFRPYMPLLRMMTTFIPHLLRLMMINYFKYTLIIHPI